MLPRNHPDRIRIVFDDHRLVANAGLLLPATLDRHLGLRELVDHHLDLGGAPGRANTGDKLMTLVASAMAGAAGAPLADRSEPLRRGSRSRVEPRSCQEEECAPGSRFVFNVVSPHWQGTRRTRRVLYDCKRISCWIDRRLTGLAGPDYDVPISFGLPL